MAIIKTNNAGGIRRVVTKTSSGNRRVSCSCCGEAPCCYYNIEEGYNVGLWTFADLPNELDLWFSNEPNFGGPLLEGPFLLSHNGDGTYGNGNVVGGKFVDFAVDGWVSGENQGFGPCGPAPCLFTEDVPEGGQSRCYVKDRFANTYSVTVTGIDPSNYYASTITRIGLCQWVGSGPIGNQESDVSIFYWDGISENVPDVQGAPQHGWHCILGVPFAFRKTDPQNGPVGTYEFGGGVTVTIS
jgi:hypothetical protein